MARFVSIRTGARLHFGLLTNRPVRGREFGGIGLLVSEPGWHLEAEDADSPTIEVSTLAARANPETAERVAAFVACYRKSSAIEQRPLRIRVEAAIPGHQGLGSGTQLALTVAKALAVLSDDDASAIDLARRIQRGRRSAIGIWGFEHGGFLVDGGKRSGDGIGELVARLDIPADWRFLLVTPASEIGLSGADEIAAFGSLPVMSEATTGRLCQMILMNLLPALAQSNFEEFASALFEYGRLVGEYFEPIQGGVFASQQVRELAGRLSDLGLPLPVQTSWGPTCAIPCRSRDEAQSLADQIAALPRMESLQQRIVAPLNQPARVQFKATP